MQQHRLFFFSCLVYLHIVKRLPFMYTSALTKHTVEAFRCFVFCLNVFDVVKIMSYVHFDASAKNTQDKKVWCVSQSHGRLTGHKSDLMLW